MNNKYRIKINENYIQNSTNHYRWQKTLQFLNNPDYKIKNGLDIGDRNPLTISMENKFSIKFKNTDEDLDVKPLKGNYDIVTSFEILEHLYNPLFNLLEIHKVLNENGILYLSTPLYKPPFLWSPNHFHEMRRESILNLFKRAKFEIIREDKFKIHPIIFYFKGIRPLIRFFYERVQIFELRKVNSNFESQ